jgi:hypothetical protein
MFSILHFIEAKARLKESIKTIEMMGGEDECQPMLLGQMDMIQLEVDYYRPRAYIWFVVLAILPIILIFFAPTIYGFITNTILNCCGR